MASFKQGLIIQYGLALLDFGLASDRVEAVRQMKEAGLYRKRTEEVLAALKRLKAEHKGAGHYESTAQVYSV